MRTPGHADLLRTENVVARAIETKGGSLKLETVLARIADMGFDAPTAEATLRYLVGRGDFIAKVSPKRKTVRLSVSPPILTMTATKSSRSTI